MTTSLAKDQLAKILTPDAQHLLKALRGSARIVGGAVRDALLDRKVGDVDFATLLPPEQVMELLAKSGIKTVPTGITHGTVTAVLDHVGFEITTLRCDVKTDGRHAEVVFTEDWREDAARRDFTMNALYLDADKKLYDYFGGAEDAKAGRVRFIGDARARIREDVLRILRFFRFFAHFGKDNADAEGFAACSELASLIPTLSAERIARELIKLLAADNPLPSVLLMKDAGVLSYTLPEAKDFSRLNSLLETEKQNGAMAEALVRLSAILPQDEKTVSTVAARLKLSNRDTARLGGLVKMPVLSRGNLAPAALHRMIYKYGVELCRGAAFLNGGDIQEALEILATWEVPVFPVKGEDVVKLGVPAGPGVGVVLSRVEKWWIEGDFKADRAACLVQAWEYGKNP